MENTGTDNHISARRIWQIRQILKNTKKEDLDQMVSDTWDSIRAIIFASYPQSNKENKSQKTQLRIFINKYISWLSFDEITDLTNRIEYYEEKYEKCSWDIEEEIIEPEDAKLLPLNKRIERLLINGSLLPNTDNKKDFNSEMNSLMARLKARIENEALKSWFVLWYIEAGMLLDIIREFWEKTYDFSIWEEMKSYLSSINFTISLNELCQTEEWNSNNEWFEEFLDNNLKFEIVCNKFWKEWVSKKELKSHFELQWYKMDWDDITLFQNDHIEIKAYLYESRFEDEFNETFTLEIYAKRKKDKITSIQFLELSMWKLSFTVEKIINEIYKSFWAPKQRHTFDIEKLFEKAGSEDWDDWCNWGNCLDVKRKDKWEPNNKKTIKESKNPKIECSDIILEDTIMKELEMLEDQFNNEQHYIDHWVIPPKWVILHWPAWTWKTLFAKHISNKIDAEFIVINISEVLNKWMWNNEKNMQNIFTYAKTLADKGKKVILFFDEADWLFEKRSDIITNKEWLITVLLQEMDWINENSLKNIFVFFTTNRLDVIDKSVSSRFDKKIEIWLPNDENRIKLFKLYIWEKIKASKHELFKDLDYELLAKKTKWKSWRFIKQLVNNAVLSFAHSRRKNPESELITTKDIIKGIKLVDSGEKVKNEIWFQAGK